MRLIKQSTPLFLATFICFNLFAQSDKLKWGKIPADELSMPVYDKDPSTGAVVLDDQGVITFEATSLGELALFYKRRRRVKI